jgi:tRNA A37 threonylcarbamoyladenosine dehydratase
MQDGAAPGCGVPEQDSTGAQRRFAGVDRLYGPGSLACLNRAQVAVVGLGGVGSWAAEALARSGVGGLTLIDLDHLSESNTNRQLLALDPHFGRSKCEAMAERVRAIQPGVRLQVVDDFVTPENAAALIAGCTAVIDCIDQVRAKAALVVAARAAGSFLVCCGAAGARRDPLQLRCGDLAQVRGDALLSALRQRLRRDHGYARGNPRPGAAAPQAWGVPVIHSVELPAGARPSGEAGAALACAGYGSAVTVTATFGLAAAARVIEFLLAGGVDRHQAGPGASA